MVYKERSLDIYRKMQEALKTVAEEEDIIDSMVEINCKALSATEAIGNTEHDDYPIHKGKEVMVEASFKGAKGQAFTDHYENSVYKISDLIEMKLDNNRSRASFISSLNAIWKYLGKADKTIHCKDKEPVECANELAKYYDITKKTLLIGLQPRFLEVLAAGGEVRVLDLDIDNIGKSINGVIVEDGQIFAEAVEWCEQIFATGSTLCNATLSGILATDKPVTFFGITIAAAAEILGLKVYCYCGK